MIGPEIELPGFCFELKNAYAQNQLPDSLSDFQEAVKTGFNRRIIAGFQTAGMSGQFKGTQHP